MTDQKTYAKQLAREERDASRRLPDHMIHLRPSDSAERIARYDNEGKIMPKHTPGPWSLEYGTTKQDYRVVKVGDGLRSIVADLRSYWVCEEHGTSDANARLIAAAPDLLEAAEAIALDANITSGTFDAGNEESDGEPIYLRVMGFEWRALLSAIARARGGE